MHLDLQRLLQVYFEFSLKFLLGNMLGSCGMLCYNLHCLNCSKKICNVPI